MRNTVLLLLTFTTIVFGQYSARSYCEDVGASDTYSCSFNLSPAAYVAGNVYRFKANTANTGAATINLNTLGAKSIVKVVGGVTTALADNDIRAGQVVDLVYDGTNMQMQSTFGNAVSLPATVVQTNQTNTYSTGAQDMGSATSHKIPTSGGAAPVASGLCAIDSTRGTEKCYDDLLGTSTARVTIASAQVSSSDTLSCTTINTTPTLFATTYTIPASTLIANKVLHAYFAVTVVGSGSITMRFKAKLGTVAIFDSGAVTPAAATRLSGGIFQIQGTAAAGASVNVDTAEVGVGANMGPFGSGTDTLTQPVAIATNASQVLGLELTCSANTAGNSVTLRQLVVEVLN